MSLGAVLLLAVVSAAFISYCLVDIVRAQATRWLPKWVWAIFCVMTIPLGGVIYLLVGRTYVEQADD